MPLAPSFDHLLRLSDDVGIFEHANLTEPRTGHGYCVDDVSRLLIVIARHPEPERRVQELARTAMRFLVDAQMVDGRIRNRRAYSGKWTDSGTTQDCWGRALWAFGSAVRYSPDPALRQASLACFERSARLRSPWPRSMAFAALGAAELVAADRRHFAGRQLLSDAVDIVGRPAASSAWPWPEARLTYANAAIPEALIAAGDLLGRDDVLRDGLLMLAWLLERETVTQHLSLTPVGGSGPGDRPPAFDQQPIEAAAMADACHRAYVATGDAKWLQGVHRACTWFTGNNDVGVKMYDPRSGGGYDGLHDHGPNLNQGAESTLAMVSALQHLQRLQ